VLPTAVQRLAHRHGRVGGDALGQAFNHLMNDSGVG
jgi:hypothetical protein